MNIQFMLEMLGIVDAPTLLAWLAYGVLCVVALANLIDNIDSYVAPEGEGDK